MYHDVRRGVSHHMRTARIQSARELPAFWPRPVADPHKKKAAAEKRRASRRLWKLRHGRID